MSGARRVGVVRTCRRVARYGVTEARWSVTRQAPGALSPLRGHNAGVPSRRSNPLADALPENARWLRWPLRVVGSFFAVIRWFWVVMAVGGVVNIAVGLATLDARRGVFGFGQLLLAGYFVGQHAFAKEAVIEAGGPAGDFVMRSNIRRGWRDTQGWRRLVAVIRGEHSWVVAVRRRADDPFGPIVLRLHEDGPRAAVDAANDLARRIHQGDEKALQGQP